MASERSLSRTPLIGVLGRKCGKVRRYSGVWYFFWMGNVWKARGEKSDCVPRSLFLFPNLGIADEH
jgi:hypothetical protein